MNSRHQRFGLVALLAGATGIGFAPIFVRLSEVDPTATAFHRLLLAQPLLWLWVWIEQRGATAPRRPATRRELGMLAAAGIFFAGDMALWNWSLRFTAVANSTLLTNFAPIFVTLGAWLLLREKITARFLAGMALALGGATMLVGTSLKIRPHYLLGDGLAFSTALFYAGYLLCVSRLRRAFSTATIMAWSGVASCAGLGLITWISGERAWPGTATGWLVLLALALVSHIGGQSLIAYGFGHLPASFSSVSLLWQPFVAAVAAWVWLQEPLGLLQAASGVVILLGIATATGSLRAPERVTAAG